jgi:dolichol-phosphate mannosyltransferase
LFFGDHDAIGRTRPWHHKSIGTAAAGERLKSVPPQVFAETGTAGIYVLLPVLNEIANIERLLDGIRQMLGERDYTIGLVDDGSTDGTLEYLQKRMLAPNHRMHLISQKKMGRGSQRGGALHQLLIWGLQNTSHDIFIEIDGDLSHRPEELPVGIQIIESGCCDIAIASKFVRGGRTVHRSFGRRQVSRVCSFALRLLLDWRIKDYSNGYRFYSREAARMLSQRRIRYTSPIYLSEALAAWLHAGLRAQEFPTIYVGRNEGLSKLRLIDLAKAVFASFEIATRYHVTGFPKVGIQDIHPVPIHYKAIPAADESMNGTNTVDARAQPHQRRKAGA